MTPARKRELAQARVKEQDMTVQQACQTLRLPRSGYYYRARVKDDALLITAIQAYLTVEQRHGFDKLYPALRKQGYPWNHKRVRRVYGALKLNLPRRGKRRLPERVKLPLIIPTQPNQCWSIDFITVKVTM